MQYIFLCRKELDQYELILEVQFDVLQNDKFSLLI